MENKQVHSNWTDFIEIFNKRYKGRPTRLGVFDHHKGVTNDYWIESGLPLESVNFETRGGVQNVRLHMGKFSHEIGNVLKLTITLTRSGEEDGIDLLDGNGTTTVLRIEPAFTPL